MLEGEGEDRDRQQGDLISLLLFFQNKESTQKMDNNKMNVFVKYLKTHFASNCIAWCSCIRAVCNGIRESLAHWSGMSSDHSTDLFSDKI
jgi:hypothetical protein